MSNILKTSAYRLNIRNGVRGAFGDHIKVTREFGPILGEDPTSVRYLFSSWIKFDPADIYPNFIGKKLLFAFGDKFYCFFESSPMNGDRLVCGFWTISQIDEYAFHYFRTDFFASMSTDWHLWSVEVFGAHEATGENVRFFLDGEVIATTEVPGEATIVKEIVDFGWQISSKLQQPLSSLATDLVYEDCFLYAWIADVSIFVKESLNVDAIVPFLYNKGCGIDANEYLDELDGARLGLYLPLSDGWMNTKTPGKGRRFFDDTGVAATGYFEGTPNTTDRPYDFPGRGGRVFTPREKYLSHTRSNDRFVSRAFPEFLHQVAWINRSIPVTDFPDAEGL